MKSYQSEKSKLSKTQFKKVFIELLWPRRGRLALGFALILVSRLCGLVLPYSSKIFIDDVVQGGEVSLTVLLFVVSTAVIIQGISSFCLTMLLSVEAHRVILSLRTKLQKHVLRLPIAYFDSAKTGALVSRIMTDVEGVRNLVGTGVVQLFGGILQSMVAFVILMNIDMKMTLLTLIPLGIFALVAHKAFSFIRPIFRDRRVINADVTGRLTETLGGVRVIKGFNAELVEDRVFKKGAERLFENVRKSLLASSLVTSASVLLIGLTSVVIMGYGGDLIQNGQLSVGDFVAFTLILAFLIAPIFQMANIGTQITEAFAGLDRMEEMLEEVTEGTESKRTKALESFNGEICFENVTFGYQKDVPVLSNINLKAQPGTVTALVGSSGSGKSTLAGLAASFLSPTSGEVLVDGINLEEIKLDEYRRFLGVVLQDDFLFEGSIRDNILFSKVDATEEELLAAAEAAYVTEFTDRFDKGLETLIGERGVKLSGGQRQRVAIARAILANPKVLILDEATSSLDAESERFIQKSINTLVQGRTTIVIAHRLSTIQNADQILVVEDGEIVEEGDHSTLLKKDGRYQDLYRYQARI